MSHALKNKPLDWQPSASIANLNARAAIMQRIRHFFHTRNVLEVETPLLCRHSVTDPFIQSIEANVRIHRHQAKQRYYLQTSPEYAMKRLLAAGSGAIFQICKAFREGDIGARHNPEFTMLEWYRPDFDHHALMNEMDEFLQTILSVQPATRFSYAELFSNYLGFDPHSANLETVIASIKQQNINLQDPITDIDTGLMLLMSHCIEPHIGQDRPVFIYDFPVTQSALARIQPTSPPTAARFEVYYQGMELANGFHELQDANEQRHRFSKNNNERQQLKLDTLPIDEYFLTALESGLPNCAGVAIGIDRLIMLALNQPNIRDIISFDFSRV